MRRLCRCLSALLLLALALPVSLPGQRNPTGAVLWDYGGLLPPSGHAALEAKILEVEAARGWKVVPSTYTSAIPQIGGNFGGWLAGQTGTVLFYLPAGFEGGLPYIGVSPDLEYVLPWQFRQRIAAEEMTAPFLQLDHYTALMDGMQALLAPPSSGPFIYIGAEKYYHGDVAVFCRTNDTLLLSAYLGETVPFGQAVWEGASPHGSNSAKVPFSFAAGAIAVKVVSPSDTVEIEITIAFDELRFEESENQQYAFDDNKLAVFFKQRESLNYQISGDFIDHPAYDTENSRRYPWKYVPVNETDEVKAVLQNTGMKRGLQFSIGHEQFSITPRQAESEQQIIRIGNHCTPGAEANTLITSEHEGLMPCDSSALNVYGDSIIQKKIAIVNIRKDSADTFSQAYNQEDLSRNLSGIYMQAGVKFDISYFTEVVDFDLNDNGKVDFYPDLSENEYSAEVETVINHLKGKPDDYAKFHAILILFDTPPQIQYVNSDGNEEHKYRKGRMKKGNKYGEIYLAAMASTNQRDKTIAHELGHGLFSLHHPWDEFDYPSPISGGWGPDPENLMGYKPDGISLRRIHQLKQIHNK